MAMLEVKDLHTSFFTPAGEVKAVNGVSFYLDHGKVLGIVGESGSGKSVTAYSIMQILEKTGKIVSGSIKFNGQELVGAGEKAMKSIRGNKISIIFQDPMTSLNPTYTIGKQLMEAIMLHTPRNKQQARERAIEMLRLVNINEPEKRMKQYPFEFSGGMRQRIMIAMALACEPDILIADEPTTALDVTIQAQILDLLQDIKNKIDGSILLITHDLGVIAEMADYVVVMYAGKVIEKGTVYEIFQDPRHPYTIGLQKSKPTMALDDSTELYNIPGNVPNPINMPSHCFFKERCAKCTAKCSGEYPGMVQVSPTHFVACHLYDEENNNG
jgi:oligopeptide transport system ATP-binding protein